MMFAHVTRAAMAIAFDGRRLWTPPETFDSD